MKSNKQDEIKKIVDKIILMKWENLQGSLEAVKYYRHILLECENDTNIFFEIEYTKGKLNELK